VTKPLRLLLLLPDLSGGGAERTTLNLRRYLDSERFEVVVGVLEERGEYLRQVGEGDYVAPREGIVRGLARRAKPDSVTRGLLQVPLIRSLIAAQRPDIVMSSMSDVSIPLAQAWRLAPALRRKTRWIVREGNNTEIVHRESVANPRVRNFVNRAVARSYAAADAVLVPCNGVANGLVANYGLRRESIAVIGNPVDLEAVEAAAREEPDIPLPEKFIVAVGRLAWQKGFDLLIRAFASLDAPDYGLVILGEGPERASLTSLARELGVEDRLHLPGFLANPWSVLARADAFCLSSRWEGFGHVVIEAMACGTPVLVSDCPYGPDEIVSDNVNGLVVPHGAWEPLAAGLKQIIQDRDDALKRAEAGRDRARDFAAEKIAKQYADLFLRGLPHA
jgi:glycosyltransferase involved in cell wall biosynthesis